MNILIPMAGKSPFYTTEEFLYPKPLVEIMGKPMVQYSIGMFDSLEEDKNFIFVLDAQDCVRFYLDNIVKLLAGEHSKVVTIAKPTRGAACSCLMAIDAFNSDQELIISNYDQIIDFNISKVVEEFRLRKADAGVITFETVHPRWSFVRADSDGWVLEASEKRPISKSGIAGFYYFAKGKGFAEAAFSMIEKRSSVEGGYFIAPVLNQMILNGEKVLSYSIDANRYHSFYTPKLIDEFEKLMSTSKRGV